ncbi:hypothetical protein Rcae01_00310 [Novipirellula caenicola]|uniref:Uncharacterized protein n=1 Tax=Novipirellula caenicola TaxID=1536901 RepID=A0ABP9VI33_9BACT
MEAEWLGLRHSPPPTYCDHSPTSDHNLIAIMTAIQAIFMRDRTGLRFPAFVVDASAVEAIAQFFENASVVDLMVK